MIYLCVSKNSVSSISLKIQAFVGAHLLPIVAPDISRLIWLLNSKKKKKKNVSKKVWHLYKLPVGIFFYSHLTSTSFRALSPTL